PRAPVPRGWALSGTVVGEPGLTAEAGCPMCGHGSTRQRGDGQRKSSEQAPSDADGRLRAPSPRPKKAASAASPPINASLWARRTDDTPFACSGVAATVASGGAPAAPAPEAVAALARGSAAPSNDARIGSSPAGLDPIPPT